MGYAKAAIVFLTLACASLAHAEEGRWDKVTREGHQPVLRYRATTTLLGRTVPATVEFYCDPKSTKESKGALGFDLFIDGVKSLAPFSFDDFEGPDAATRKQKLMRITITSTDANPLTFQASPSGWYAQADRFGFGVSAPSSQAKSVARSIVTAIAAGGAENLSITITDPRDPKGKLQVDVPVQGEEAKFRALIAGLSR